MKNLAKALSVFFLFVTPCFFAQNQASQWYFGGYAALDFMSSPPAVLTNTNLNTGEGMASIADAAGNLLFYTDGTTIWNQQQQVMANGTGLMGNLSSTQSALIAKQPGNANKYYVFTVPDLYYSVVDMSLAAGMGSVTTKNVLLASATSEKLTGVKHCNGTDVWIITHSFQADSFQCFLLSAAGINTVAVVSTIGSATSNYYQGYMKASPTGKKIGLAKSTSSTLFSFDVFDFDNSSGIVSNYLNLIPNTGNGAYDCEFSPDGTKFYGAAPAGVTGKIFQWDLCAGSNAAILASQYIITPQYNDNPWALQLAPNGKIYIGTYGKQWLGVIDNPNVAGAGCSYTTAAQSIGTGSCQLGLPNFISSYLVTPPGPVTVTNTVNSAVSCNTATFSAMGTGTNITCSASWYAGVNWNFGDPASGAANTSTLASPVHVYMAPGNYTATAIIYYNCRVDTVKQPVTINGPGPDLFVAGNFTICAGQVTTLTATGANTYSWSTGAVTATVALSPTVTTAYSVTGTNTLSNCGAGSSFSIVVATCVGLAESLANTGNAQVYPNPNQGNFLVECLAPVQLLLYDPMGRLMMERTLLPGKHNIDISAYACGVYYLKMVENSVVSMKRLIKSE